MDDEFGAHYYRIGNTGDDEDNSMIIYPGKSGKIKLAFQKPSPNAKHLILSFPKFNVLGTMESGTPNKEDLVVKIDLDANKVTAAKIEENHSVELAFGQEYRKDGVVIKVKNAELKYLTRKEAKLLESYTSIVQNKRTKKVLVTAISYEFINDTKDKKIDLSRNFGFHLTDDFNNEYNSYLKPEDVPSLYPGESYGETIFFEAPIGTAKYLLLNIDASNVGIQNKIIVKIPVEKISK